MKRFMVIAVIAVMAFATTASACPGGRIASGGKRFLKRVGAAVKSVLPGPR
jgi:hypothetical protein